MSLAARLLSGLVLLLFTAAGGYWVGDHQSDNAWLAKEAKVKNDAHAEYEAEVKRGNEAAGNYLTDLADREDRYAKLERQFHELRQTTSLVADSPDVCGGVHGVAGDMAGSKPAPSALGDHQQPALGGVAIASPRLSNAAVWMWNSALSGRDVPSGACGADATTSGACAAASGLTLSNAWDNHEANAKSCAKDRLRYQRLIDLLNGRGTRPTQAQEHIGESP